MEVIESEEERSSDNNEDLKVIESEKEQGSDNEAESKGTISPNT